MSATDEASDESNTRRTPTASSDLTPVRTLPSMELLLLPFFWLAPLMAVGLGYAMSRDTAALNDEYDVDLPDTRYLFYVLPVTLSHLAGLVWRAQRRNWIAKRLGFDQSAFNRARKAHESGRVRAAVVAVAVGQFVALVALAVVPVGPAYRLVTDALVVGFLLAWGLSPFVVGYDAHVLPRVDHVDWGRWRYVYVPATVVPLVSLVYLVKRDDHVWCATLVEHWETDPREFNVDEGEKSSLERFADWSNDVF